MVAGRGGVFICKEGLALRSFLSAQKKKTTISSHRVLCLLLSPLPVHYCLPILYAAMFTIFTPLFSLPFSNAARPKKKKKKVGQGEREG